MLALGLWNSKKVRKELGYFLVKVSYVIGCDGEPLNVTQRYKV